MKQKVKYSRRKTTFPKKAVRGIIISYKVSRLSVRPIRTSKQAYTIINKLWSKELKDLQEQVMALYLDTDHYVIGYRLLNTGTMVASFVDVKLLVSLALQFMAFEVILVHNHPCDNALPSTADFNMTTRVQKALLFFDIILADHIILSKTGYYSFANKSKLLE